MDGAYRTVGERGRAAFAVRGSEFVGHAAPVDSVEAAEAFVAAVGEEFPDATHTVPAYRVRVVAGRERSDDESPAGDRSDDGGPRRERPEDGPPDAERLGPGGHPPRGAFLREYAADDGEPTGSAGKPALNVLVQRELVDVAVVVTRYYGGTNLGVGGLARAYSRAAREAIDDAGVRTREPHERFRVTVDYDDSGTVRGVLESVGVEFEAEYGERAAFAVRVPRTDAADLRDRLLSATSGRADLADHS